MAGTSEDEYVPRGLTLGCNLDDPEPFEVEHMGETLWITIRRRRGHDPDDVRVIFDGPDFHVRRTGLKVADRDRVPDRRRTDPPPPRGRRVDPGHDGGKRGR